MSNTLTESDLASIGGALLAMVVACNRLGHATPAETLDYLNSDGHGDMSPEPAVAIVRDFTAWAARRQSLFPGAQERLAWFVEDTGFAGSLITRMAAERATTP